ncbi:hypothetical protein PG988_012486 [Apiospora saccharicola]
MQPKPRPCHVPNCGRDIEDDDIEDEEDDDIEDEEDYEEEEEEDDEKECPACTCTWVYQPGGCDSDNHTVGERCEWPVEGDNGRCERHDPPCSMCQDNRATRSWSGDRDEQDVCGDCYQSFSWMRKSKPKPKSVKTKMSSVVSADLTRLATQDDSPVPEVQRGTKRRKIA